MHETAAAPVALETRLKLLDAVEREVARVARRLGAPASVTLAAQAKITHALIHRLISYRGRGLDVDRLLARLEEIAQRRLVREWRRRAIHGPVLDDEETRRILSDPFPKRVRFDFRKAVQCHNEMTPLEREILRLDEAGYTSQQSARILGITPNGVKFHRSQAQARMKKLFEESR
jgi:DNA-directed RNA polymerase specialized sigma24 family protein